MKTSIKLTAAVLLNLGALVALSSTASAAVVCNQEGVCWHAHHAYRYAPAYGVVVHPNNWRWGPNEHYVWKEHPGRGYWRGGVWVAF